MIVNSSESKMIFNFYDLNINILSNSSILVSEIINKVKNFSFTSNNGTIFDLKFINNFIQWKSKSNSLEV